MDLLEILQVYLPVRRYLVPTATVEGRRGGGGGVVISRTVDSTTFNFGMPLGLPMRGKNTGRVNDLSLVRFPWQLMYVRVFSTKF